MSVNLAARASLAALQRVAGESVVYRAKDGRSKTLTVVFGDSQRERTAERGFTSIVRTDDALLSTAAFEAAFGESSRPEDGDTIERDSRKYRVRPLAGESSVREKLSVMLRVHLTYEGTL